MDNLLMQVPEIFYAVHRKCNADWVIEEMEIDFYDATYVVAGSGVYEINGERFNVAEGSLLFIPPGSVRKAWTAQENLMELYAVNFFSPHAQTFELCTGLGIDPKLVLLFSQLTRVWVEREEMYALDAGALAVQIFCELYRRVIKNKPVNQIDERVEKVKDFVNENYNKKLTLALLADVVGLNPVYLGALFSQKEKCTIREYINKVRVQNAYEIIRSEKLPINDVALDCGFTDAFYFSRVFKKYIGVSPSSV